jgi:hypothetical protein
LAGAVFTSELDHGHVRLQSKNDRKLILDPTFGTVDTKTK